MKPPGGPPKPGPPLPKPPLPGGGPPRIWGGATAAGVIMAADGPPTPLTGPWRPGSPPIPLPAARPIPGPPEPGIGTRGIPSSCGGGPSTVIDTIFSPLKSTKPSTRFSSLSFALAVFGRSFLNSSQSPRIKFLEGNEDPN